MRSRLLKEIFKESNDLIEILEEKSEEECDDGTEEGYKIIMLTVLPLLLDGLRLVIILLSLLLGTLLAQAL